MKQYWNMYHTASLDQCTRKGQKLTSMSQLTGSSRPLLVGELYIKEKQHGEAQRVTAQLCWSCSLNKKLSILTWHAPRGGLAGLYWGHYSQSALCSVWSRSHLAAAAFAKEQNSQACAHSPHVLTTKDWETKRKKEKKEKKKKKKHGLKRWLLGCTEIRWVVEKVGG